MMIMEILKWMGIGIAILFGIGCVLSLVLIAVVIKYAIQEKQEKKELPFHCVVFGIRCPTPALPCTQCEKYQEKMGEQEHDNQD